MVWVFPEYGGQVAVQADDWKLVRTGLKTKKPSGWEVYDLKDDPGETKNRASDQQERIRRTEELLKREVKANAIFPLSIPNVTPAD